MRSMRGLWRLIGVLVCMALAATVTYRACAAEVQAVRVSSHDGSTRAVLDLSQSTDYKLFQLSDPARVVLDLADSDLGADFDDSVTGGIIQGVRTGRRDNGGLRVVLDLSRKASPSSFLLDDNSGHGQRLVVDLGSTDGAADAGKPAVADNDEYSVRQSENRAAELLHGARRIVIVVDAGHGGKDPGARGHQGTLEKNVTLAVSKKLAHRINQHKGMKAVLTRDDDTYVPLQRRYQIAREHNADLFISVHADAFKRGDAKGSSVWVLSTDGKVSEAARWLADRQNRSDLVGGVSLQGKSDSLASTLLDLQQGYALETSSHVAQDVFQSLARLGPTHRDHIEHANFVVLRSPDVPSILVETAFITHPAGERKLRSASYQKKLAGAIFNGVDTYFRSKPPRGTWYALQARRKRGELAGTAGSGNTYEVTHGDTLSTIAQRYDVSVNALRTANNLDSNMLRAGAELTIPTG